MNQANLQTRFFPRHKSVHSASKPVNLNWKTISDIFERQPAFFNNAVLPNGKPCTPHWLIGTCETGHPINAYPVRCKRPDCPICGKPGSQAHRERLMNVLKHVSIDSTPWRYFVFPIPKSNQELMHDPKRLQSLKKFLTRCLKERFQTKASLNAWHFMGDKSPEFFVHLNTVTPGGWVDPADLKWLKEKFTWWLLHKGGMPNFKNAIVNVEYMTDEAQKYHVLKYITRPTLPIMTQDRYAVYRKMRVVSYSGEWRGNPDEDAYETISDINASDLVAQGKYEQLAEARRCVKCGKVLNLTFHKKSEINIDDYVEFIPDVVFIKYVRGP